MVSQSSTMVCRISSAKPSPARWLSPGSVYSSASGSRATTCCPWANGTMWSRSPCHQRTGILTCVEPEPPVPGEHDDVGERRGHLFAAAVEQIVEEHRLEFRPHQQPPIAFGGHPRVQVQRGLGDRLHQADQTDRRPPDREPGHREQRRHRRSECHQSAADRVGADRRRHAAEHPDRHDAVGHRRRASQGVGAAAGQADDGHLVDAQGVGDGAQVIGERDDVLVLVRRRRPDAGSVDADQPDVVLLGVDPGLGRDLPSRAGGAVQPEDRATLRIAELGEPELTIVADRDVAFQLGTSNR